MVPALSSGKAGRCDSPQVSRPPRVHSRDIALRTMNGILFIHSTVANVPQMGYTVVMNIVTKTAFIRARVEPRVKREAEAVFRAIGVDTTSAVTMFLKQVSLYKGIPFDIHIPNKVTRDAFNEKFDKRSAYKDASRLMADILAGK